MSQLIEHFAICYLCDSKTHLNSDVWGKTHVGQVNEKKYDLISKVSK